MTPESVGLGEESNLVLGKHSGRAAFEARLTALGHTELTPEQIKSFTAKFKEIADEKKVRVCLCRHPPHALLLLPLFLLLSPLLPSPPPHLPPLRRRSRMPTSMQ